MAARHKIVAIGETGLDFHYERARQHRFCQYRWFVYQLLLAHRLRVLRLLKPLMHGGVVHCFGGDWRTTQAYLRLGLHLGIGGALLQEGNEALSEAVRQMPLERILLETDSPYVHPDCAPLSSGNLKRKARNTSLILPAVAARIATLKGISPEAVESQTTANARALFQIQ